MNNEWNEVKCQNTSIRAVVNGRLSSVPEDFYDYLIRSYIPVSEFKLARIIGEIIGRNLIGVSDWWLKIINMIMKRY